MAEAQYVFQKGTKDKAKLVKKTITNKAGKRQVVWVKPAEVKDKFPDHPGDAVMQAMGAKDPVNNIARVIRMAEKDGVAIRVGRWDVSQDKLGNFKAHDPMRVETLRGTLSELAKKLVDDWQKREKKMNADTQRMARDQAVRKEAMAASGRKASGKIPTPRQVAVEREVKERRGYYKDKVTTSTEKYDAKPNKFPDHPGGAAMQAMIDKTQADKRRAKAKVQAKSSGSVQAKGQAKPSGSVKASELRSGMQISFTHIDRKVSGTVVSVTQKGGALVVKLSPRGTYNLAPYRKVSVVKSNIASEHYFAKARAGLVKKRVVDKSDTDHGKKSADRRYSDFKAKMKVDKSDTDHDLTKAGLTKHTYQTEDGPVSVWE